MGNCQSDNGANWQCNLRMDEKLKIIKFNNRNGFSEIILNFWHTDSLVLENVKKGTREFGSIQEEKKR